MSTLKYTCTQRTITPARKLRAQLMACEQRMRERDSTEKDGQLRGRPGTHSRGQGSRGVPLSASPTSMGWQVLSSQALAYLQGHSYTAWSLLSLHKGNKQKQLCHHTHQGSPAGAALARPVPQAPQAPAWLQPASQATQQVKPTQRSLPHKTLFIQQTV